MRIGIVTDIHDAVGPLETAISRLRAERAERIVTLGDAFESHRTGEPGAEVARLLHAAGAIGVWGNHDFGLSHDVQSAVLESADPALIAFASRLLPHVVFEGCRFSHIEPWRSAHSIEDLWTFESLPDTIDRLRSSLSTVPERILFMGHHHACRVVGLGGPKDWTGAGSVHLGPPDRYLVTVPAVIDGWCGLFDTANFELRTISYR